MGLDAWGQTPPLIRRCELGAACRRGQPFYVSMTPALAKERMRLADRAGVKFDQRGAIDPHNACRQAAYRARQRRPGAVTAIVRKIKK